MNDELFNYAEQPEQLHLDLDYTTLFNEKLNELATYRNAENYTKSSIVVQRDNFNKSLEYLLETLKTESAKVLELETEIKALALELYQTTQIKDIHEKIKERDYTEFVYDRVEATKWCQYHDLFLLLDTRAFESYLRSLKNKGLPGFVTVEIKPTITIAQEL